MRTLDEMLSHVSGSGTPGTEKTAAAGVDIVDRLRKAAAVDPAPDELRDAASRELAEKTAEIMVVTMTLSEFEQAVNGAEKTAAVAEPTTEQKRTAIFIKTALERGYSTDEIGIFLHQQATGQFA